MSERKYQLHNGQKGAALAIRVTPKASRNEISEVTGDGTIKVRLTEAIAEGKANTALVGFLAEVLKIPTTKIEIVAGASGRDKLVSILDLDADTVHARILEHLA